MNVLRPFTTGHLTILLQKNSTLIVLEHDVLLDLVSLRQHEVPCPTNRWHTIIYSHQLGLGGAAHITLLFGRIVDRETSP